LYVSSRIITSLREVMPRLVDTCLEPKRRCIGLHHRSQEGSSIGAVVERWLSILSSGDLKHIAARVSAIVADRRRRHAQAIVAYEIIGTGRLRVLDSSAAIPGVIAAPADLRLPA